MGYGQQRRIVIPAAASAAQVDRLRDALQRAAEDQNRVAGQCPYVLSYSSPWEQRGDELVIGHEDAVAGDPAAFFDAKRPLPDSAARLGLAAALIEALHAGLVATNGVPRTHGGLCPGVLVTDRDGVQKLTDFGVAPALWQAFGAEAYVNLAVGPRADATGVWEILPPEVEDRDDRLCGFIDPDKIMRQELGQFPPTADLFAAGLILHLWAEHVHPYLYFDPYAHRYVEMAKSLGFVPRQVFHTDELREAARTGSPEDQAWCKLVSGMLADRPEERPTAADALAQIRRHVTPLDAARIWVQRLERLVAAEDWPAAEGMLADKPTTAEWSAELVTEFELIEQRIHAWRQQVDARHAAETWLAELERAVREEDLEAAESALAQRPEAQRWPGGFDKRVADAEAWVQRTRATTAVRAWGASLRAADERGAWDAIAQLLAERGRHRDLPTDVAKLVEEVESRHARYVADTTRVERWLVEVEARRGAGDPRAALELLRTPPQDVQHWPEAAAHRRRELEAGLHLEIDEGRLRALKSTAEAQSLQLTSAAIEEARRRLLTASWFTPALEFVPESESADARGGPARGRVRITLQAGPAGQQRALLTEELEFAEGESGNARLLGEAEPVAERLGKAVADELVRVQTERLREFAAKPKRSLFPDARVTGGVGVPAAQVEISVALLPKEAGGEPLQVPMRWSVEQASWKPAEPTALTDHALRLVTAHTERAVWEELLARSTRLTEYKDLVEIGLQPAGSLSDWDWPSSLSLRVKVALRREKDGPAEPLAEGTVVAGPIGRAALNLDVAQLDAALGRLIAAVQDVELRALTQRLTEWLAARSRPGKVMPQPTRVHNQPANAVALQLSPTRGQAVTVEARWRAAQLAFELPSDWETTAAETVDQAVAPPSRVPWIVGGAVVAVLACATVVGYVLTRPPSLESYLAAALAAPPSVPKLCEFLALPSVSGDASDWSAVQLNITVAESEGDRGTLEVRAAVGATEAGTVLVAMRRESGGSAAWVRADTDNTGESELVDLLARAGSIVQAVQTIQAALTAARADSGRAPLPVLWQMLSAPDVRTAAERLGASHTEVLALSAIEATLPPPWDVALEDLQKKKLRAAADASEDPNTGYPNRLVGAEGRELWLVSTRPGAGGTGSEGWRLFYIFGEIWDDEISFADARRQAAEAGGRLPTREEWSLAVRQLAEEREFAESVFTRQNWCSDETDGNEHWACGGRRVSSNLVVPRVPAAAEVGDWLASPLVMQKRAIDDPAGGVGLLPIIPVFPVE